jgi:CO/xanthine dehydrogenase Mo-binding subunit
MFSMPVPAPTRRQFLKLFGGGGEPAIICMGAVIANAIFDACGARLFQLPMTPERVKTAV